MQCRGAVQRRCHLEPHPGCAPHHAAEKTQVQLARLCSTLAHLHGHPSGTQPGKALARDQGVGIFQAGHDLANACGNQRITTWPGAPLVSARLQRDPGRGTSYIVAPCFGITQRHHLGMRATSLLGKSFTQHLPIGRGDDAAYTGVGVGKKKRLGG